jgi:uncharacterized RDD family membrane protein YckC
MDQPGSGDPTPPQSPPPQQSWQSTPQPPAPPPPAGGQPGSGMPSWTSNLTARGTVSGPAGVALADVPDRAIAYIIDAIILGIIGFIVSMLTVSVLGDNFGGIFGNIRFHNAVSSLATVALMLVVSAAYFIGMWTRMGGATAGMRVMKLTVRDAATGGPVTQPQAINRWLFLGAPLALSFLYVWGVIGWIVWIAVLVYEIYLLMTTAQSPTRQGFHDLQAKTVVAKG